MDEISSTVCIYNNMGTYVSRDFFLLLNSRVRMHVGCTAKYSFGSFCGSSSRIRIRPSDPGDRIIVGGRFQDGGRTGRSCFGKLTGGAGCRKCRVSSRDAYARRRIGMEGRVRRYPATRPRPPPHPAGAARMPPAMITRGEHDFVSESYVAGVARCLQRGGSRGKYMTLSGCSHPRPCRRTGRRIHGERSWIRSFGEYG